MCSRKCAAPLSEASSNLLPASIQTPTAAVSALAVALVATLKPFSSVVTLTSGTYPRAGRKLCATGAGFPNLVKTGSASAATRDENPRCAALCAALLSSPSALKLAVAILLLRLPSWLLRSSGRRLLKRNQVLSRVLGNVGGNLFFFFFSGARAFNQGREARV